VVVVCVLEGGGGGWVVEVMVVRGDGGRSVCLGNWGDKKTLQQNAIPISVCVCVCVCVCARALVCVCACMRARQLVCVCVNHFSTNCHRKSLFTEQHYSNVFYPCNVMLVLSS
jgi:hypothetical protein